MLRSSGLICSFHKAVSYYSKILSSLRLTEDSGTGKESVSSPLTKVLTLTLKSTLTAGVFILTLKSERLGF
jgi:hypothetical protein